LKDGNSPSARDQASRRLKGLSESIALQREIEALNALKAEIAGLLEEDPDFLISVAEGETSLLETLDALLLADAHDTGVQEGIEAALSTLDVRRQRVIQRSKRRRVLIAKAMNALEAKTLSRPTATVTMVGRAAKLVLTDEEKIDRKYFHREISYKLNRKALEQALASGEDVAGAHMSNGEPTLSIRRK
jgi:hypothetical protein